MVATDEAQYEMPKIFGKSDYLDLHQVVLDYQDGVPGSGELILQSFEEFLYKYLHFLCDHIFYPDDPSLMRFIALFMWIPEYRRQIKAYQRLPWVHKHFCATVEKIYFLYSRFDADEVKQTLNLTLLQMAKKYKDYGRPSFHNYVQKCFHYECYRNFNHVINDPVYRRLNNSAAFNDCDYIDASSGDRRVINEFERVVNEVSHQQRLQKSTFFLMQEEQEISVYHDEVLNLNWINGVTCHEGFLHLTSFERHILVSSYVHKKTDKEIADHYGVCRATINRKKQAAIQKLKGITID